VPRWRFIRHLTQVKAGQSGKPYNEGRAVMQYRLNHMSSGAQNVTRRQVVKIDREKCDGCGQCVTACAEGAIQIVGGKARLISEVYCDGLGACLGECPRGAITIVDREAEPFDEAAVRRHLEPATKCASPPKVFSGCPSAAMQEFRLNVLPTAASPEPPSAEGAPSLSHWPIQLHLVSPSAPFLNGADLFLVADCVPFACGEFHRRILRRRPVVIGCPKLDDGRAYVQKLADIFRQSALKSLTVVHMEVPCCTNLLRIAAEAIRLAGVPLPVADITISRTGQIIGETRAEAARSQETGCSCGSSPSP
jgi:ferredoxin